MVSYVKLFFLGCLITFMAFLYLFAFEKGYEKHKREIEKESSEIIMGSHTDILVAAKEVQNDEKNVKTDNDCGAIWSFNLRECLQK